MKAWRACGRLAWAGRRPFVCLIALNLVVFALAPLILGFQTKWFFDHLQTSNPDLGTALWIVAGMIALAFARILGFVAKTWVAVMTQYSTAATLWRGVFENILRELGARHLPDSPGAVVSCLRDDALTISRFFADGADSVADVAFCLVAIAVLYHISPGVTWPTIVPLIAVPLLADYFKAKLRGVTGRERAATAHVTSFIAEMFHSIETIQGAAAEDRFLEEFRRRNRIREAAMVADRVISSLVEFVASSGGVLGTSAMLIAAAGPMRDRAMTAGDFAMFIYAIQYVSVGVVGLLNLLTSYSRLTVPLNRLQHLLTNVTISELARTPGPRRFTQAGFEGMLEKEKPRAIVPFHDAKVLRLSYQYGSSGRGIRDISFQIRPLTLNVVTGSVGSGKTTLLRCVLGLLPHDGSVTWNDVPVSSPHYFFQPPIAAYCPQMPRLFSDSIHGNIQLGLDSNSNTRLSAAIAGAILERDIAGFARGLDTQIGPRGAKLSGGQVQRLAAARMLLRQASLYVLDDVTRGLDIDTEEDFWRRLIEGRGAATYLVASRSRLALQLADNILVMKAGQVVAQGSLSELLRTCEEMRNLWGRQASVTDAVARLRAQALYG